MPFDQKIPLPAIFHHEIVQQTHKSHRSEHCSVTFNRKNTKRNTKYS